VIQVSGNGLGALEARIDCITLTVHLAGHALEWFYPASSWVYKVTWDPDYPALKVTFHKKGVPYGTWAYPGTTYSDYEFFLVAASMGREVHRAYFNRPCIRVPMEM
jgi:hypothetical protein